NRTVKRYYADDSAATSVKVGYRQASYIKKPRRNVGFFFVQGFVVDVPANVGNVECINLRTSTLLNSGRSRGAQFPAAFALQFS
ncbi:hypothetical protein, partial [Massilia sp. TWP1-3-3]|uniref:hypothetical protein n=1 Tax=Massilia sp. TWP1-3-3 TaxID=2804573 RepID=UPI003CEE6B98